MKPALTLVVLVTFISFLTQAEDPVHQTTVVPQGKAGVGKKLFVEKGCYKCHTVRNTELPKLEVEPTYAIPLGGPDQDGWTRDKFAAAIMNPNHTVAEEYRILMITLGDHFKAENSPMPTFNDFLTVNDMINLATFLSELP